jgi:hypothetical protein
MYFSSAAICMLLMASQLAALAAKLGVLTMPQAATSTSTAHSQCTHASHLHSVCHPLWCLLQLPQQQQQQEPCEHYTNRLLRSFLSSPDCVATIQQVHSASLQELAGEAASAALYLQSCRLQPLV